ncbi:MAG: DUF479 domain-containing protein [Gammaproteobacteria bacterium]|nr:DUF479 domain-containing protein [Gammaproteobacteria bacterium]
MNFLAHAHLAYLTNTSITGNLLGDFIKGSVLDQLKPSWQRGVRLHRKIDIYTDSHLSLKPLKVELGPLRRFSGIILDILLDHIIAKNFEDFGNIALIDFAQLVYQDLAIDRAQQPSKFEAVTQRMIAGDWLYNYQNLDIIEQALIRTSQRISIKPDFRPALVWYQRHQQHIDDVGTAFYRDLIAHSRQQAIILSAN